MLRSNALVSVALILAAGSVASATPLPAHVLAAPRARAAAATRKNVAVGRIDGPKSAKIRLTLMQSLRESSAFSVTDAEDLKTTARKSEIAKLARSLSVDAIVLGKISNGGTLTLRVYKPDGRLVNEIRLRGRSVGKLEQAVSDQFDGTVAPPLALATGAHLSGRSGTAASGPPTEESEEPEVADAREPAAAPEPTPDPSPSEEPPADAADGSDTASAPSAEEPEKADAPHAAKPGRAPFELTAGLRGYSRHFAYTGSPYARDPARPRTLRPYDLGFAPALLVNGVLYPGAFFDDGVLGNIGIMAGGEFGLATSTNYERIQPDGSKNIKTLRTRVQSWDVGLRARIPLGPAEVALFGELGTQAFILLGDEGGTTLPPLVPDVKYWFVRLGGEARVRLGKVTLGGHVAPRVLTSLHNIDLERVWFPGAKGRGLDFGLTGGYALTAWLDVVAGADFIGYGFDFNALPTDPVRAPVVAGGATDRYYSLWGGLRLTLGGK